MRINVAIPEAQVSKPVLDAALEATTRLNEQMIADGEVPTFADALEHRKGGIRWKPEPPGPEHFDHAETVMVRGWGDCDDLAPWHAASLRHTGEDPNARAVVKKSGPKRWHAIVQRSDGSYDDPSRDAGMGKVSGINGAWVPLMPGASAAVVGAYILPPRPQIALRPSRGGWQARADIPWHWREKLLRDNSPRRHAMVTLHTAPVASTALTGALDGACELAIAGGYADPEHIERLAAMAAITEGLERGDLDWDEIVDDFGEEHAHAAAQSVVGFFGGLGKVFKKATKFVAPILKNPLVRTAASFVPGGTAATTAFDLAQQAMPSGRGGGFAGLINRARAAQAAAPAPAARPGARPMNLRCVPFG